MSSNPEFGNRLRDAMANKGYSAADTARLIGVTEKTVKRWVAGNSEPRSNRMQMLSGVLGVPLMWLINGGAQFEQEVTPLSQIERLGQKLERMTELQHELMVLSSEVADEVEELQMIEEDLEVLFE